MPGAVFDAYECQICYHVQLSMGTCEECGEVSGEWKAVIVEDHGDELVVLTDA